MQQWREATARTEASSVSIGARKKQSKWRETLEDGTKKEERIERRMTRLGRATPVSISISALKRPPPFLCSPLLDDGDHAIAGDMLPPLDLASAGDMLPPLLISRDVALSLSLSPSCGGLSPGVVRGRWGRYI